MATILVVDDNDTIREGLCLVIERMGHKALPAQSGAAALEIFDKQQAQSPSQSQQGGIDFVISDLKMDGMTGIELLAKIAGRDATIPTMIITAFGSVESAVEAMKLGAFDFLTKPFSPEVVRLKIERGLELGAERKARLRAEHENEYHRNEAGHRYGDLVGHSAVMRQVFATLEKVAATDSTVLVMGPSGTGKELVARALHQGSKRSTGPFIKVNCGALADNLLESELFGHEKGAFTGAVKRRLGRFELAHGGTLFLDEVGDISPTMQVKLLRVLQERELERVGGESTVKVDTRVISATHKNLRAEVDAGRFREDLFYRLHIVPIRIPPLTERREDIPLLIEHLIVKLAARTGSSVKRIDDAALGRLCAHEWPGNVRELENTLEQAMVFAEGETLTMAALPSHLTGLTGGADGASGQSLALPQTELPLPDLLDNLEKQLILRAYERCGGVKAETARVLGIKTSALYYKLEKYGIGTKDPSES